MRKIDADALKEDLTRFYAGEVTARDLIDEQPTIGGWISVKDRLPEQIGHRCLVSAEYGDGKRTVFEAYMGCGDSVWRTYDCTHMEIAMYADNHVHHNYHITHWMPLPEPPKEVTGYAL